MARSFFAPPRAATNAHVAYAKGSPEHKAATIRGAVLYLLTREDTREPMANALANTASETRSAATTSNASTAQLNQHSATANQDVGQDIPAANETTLEKEPQDTGARSVPGAEPKPIEQAVNAQVPADTCPLSFFAEVALASRPRPTKYEPTHAELRRFRQITNLWANAERIAITGPADSGNKSLSDGKLDSKTAKMSKESGQKRKADDSDGASASTSGTAKRIRNKFVAEPTDRVTRSHKHEAASKVLAEEDDNIDDASDNDEVASPLPKIFIRIPARAGSAFSRGSSTVHDSGATSNASTPSDSTVRATPTDVEERPLKIRLPAPKN